MIKYVTSVAVRKFVYKEEKVSLVIYIEKDKIPTNLTVVDNNDTFFDLYTVLNNSKTEQRILANIDKAVYNSPLTFIGRDRGLGALNKEHLSTGTKTLLNILYNQEICFNVVECGHNALCMLSEIQNGIIYWEHPVLLLEEDVSASIMFDGRKYSSWYGFLHEVMNR